MLCYDHSRVVLSNDEDDPTNDYINANFVDGYKQKNAYISTQGKILFKICCKNFFTQFLNPYRSTSKNHTRFLADGLGSTMFSDCDDNKNNGTWTREMSSILGTKRG